MSNITRAYFHEVCNKSLRACLDPGCWDSVQGSTYHPWWMGCLSGRILHWGSHHSRHHLQCHPRSHLCPCQDRQDPLPDHPLYWMTAQSVLCFLWISDLEYRINEPSIIRWSTLSNEVWVIPEKGVIFIWFHIQRNMLYFQTDVKDQNILYNMKCLVPVFMVVAKFVLGPRYN